MTGGVHIRPGSNITLNGVDVQRCVDLAIEMSRRPTSQWNLPIGDANYSHSEHLCAVAGARALNKFRTKGFSREICRNALWAKIVNEAQQLKPIPEAV